MTHFVVILDFLVWFGFPRASFFAVKLAFLRYGACKRIRYGSRSFRDLC
jgi:hypothetical protein